MKILALAEKAGDMNVVEIYKKGCLEGVLILRWLEGSSIIISCLLMIDHELSAGCAFRLGHFLSWYIKCISRRGENLCSIYIDCPLLISVERWHIRKMRSTIIPIECVYSSILVSRELEDIITRSCYLQTSGRGPSVMTLSNGRISDESHK